MLSLIPSLRNRKIEKITDVNPVSHHNIRKIYMDDSKASPNLSDNEKTSVVLPTDEEALR